MEDLYPALPHEEYDIVYADPPWDYGGKMQYDKTSIKSENVGFTKDVFISSASFKYPTLNVRELKTLDVGSIAAPDSLLFMWTTGPQLKNSIDVGTHWGFDYKTVAFVWDKMIHNPGQYTLSQTEFCLVMKKGRIPKPRGVRNIRQFVQAPRSKHSEKPQTVQEGVTTMFPEQRKIELFARDVVSGWANWGLDVLDGSANNLKEAEHCNLLVPTELPR